MLLVLAFSDEVYLTVLHASVRQESHRFLMSVDWIHLGESTIPGLIMHSDLAAE